MTTLGEIPQTMSPQLLHSQIPQYVHPQDLHSSSSPSESSQSSQSPQTSIESASSLAAEQRRQRIRRLSLTTVDTDNATYRPRNTPARSRRLTNSRITPRSDKHARELELNRKAATKCRNRQKQFVENLQTKCRKEEEKMQIQNSMVNALHQEVVALRNEVMRQSFCDCHYIRQSLPPLS